MGMFDTICFSCPSCKHKIEIQSKAGDCDFKNYHHTSVPPSIAEDISGLEISCKNCKNNYIIDGTFPRVSLQLFFITENECNYD